MSNDEVRVRYEQPADGVVRLVLNRPEEWNAQDVRLLYELDAGFRRAGADESVRVVIVAAEGEHFSSCHDSATYMTTENMTPVTLEGGYDQPGIEGVMAWESEAFLGLCWRWRNFPKPTIAQVQGRAWAGGLMLVWPCDLVVASTDVSFADPVVGFGMSSHEYAVHTFELGARRAKEFLFTGREILAEEALACGMVNQVVERNELEEATLRLAIEIARRPAFALRLAKAAVNQAMDAQGLWTSVQAAFSLHQLGHAQSRLEHGLNVDPNGRRLAPEFGPPSVVEDNRRIAAETGQA